MASYNEKTGKWTYYPGEIKLMQRVSGGSYEDAAAALDRYGNGAQGNYVGSNAARDAANSALYRKLGYSNGYNEDADYMQMMEYAKEMGNMEAASYYEQQRNKKIADMDAKGTNTGGYTQTNMYSQYYNPTDPEYTKYLETAYAKAPTQYTDETIGAFRDVLPELEAAGKYDEANKIREEWGFKKNYDTGAYEYLATPDWRGYTSEEWAKMNADNSYAANNFRVTGGAAGDNTISIGDYEKLIGGLGAASGPVGTQGNGVNANVNVNANVGGYGNLGGYGGNYGGVDPSKPSYESQYSDAIDRLIDQLLNRDAFSYDPESDPLFQQYRSQYLREGQRAMDDTMAAAASGAGGMNSYAVSAAQQANNYYAAQLGDRLPELVQLAYEMYLDDIDLRMQDIGLLQGMDETQYDRYRDTMDDWYNDRDFAYNQYRDSVSDAQWQQSFDYNANSDAYDRAMSMLKNGMTPSASLLASAGITAEQAQAYLDELNGSKVIGGGGGGGYILEAIKGMSSEAEVRAYLLSQNLSQWEVNEYIKLWNGSYDVDDTTPTRVVESIAPGLNIEGTTGLAGILASADPWPGLSEGGAQMLNMIQRTGADVTTIGVKLENALRNKEITEKDAEIIMEKYGY